MGKWVNADGLVIKLGKDEATSQAAGYESSAGEYKTFGPLRVTEVKLNLVDINTSTATILNDVTDIPKNARIEQVIVEVETAATSGGSATLDIGLIRYDRSTAIDADGLAAAVALTAINTAGKKLTLINGATGAGALIGTSTANPGLFTATAGTAAFTAGVLRVRVEWYAV